VGDNVPLAGFYSYGEMAPFNGSTNYIIKQWH
jgi:hypothetical protein